MNAAASSSRVRPLPGAMARHSTRAAFFIAGFGMAAWAPLVPYAKARTGVSDGALGLLLLCLGAGSIVAMPLAGMLASRFGCRRVLIAAAVVVCLALPLLGGAASPPVIALALFAFGAGVGTVDCVVNIQAVIVERASDRPLMSGFHGLFSIGGIAGAAGVTVLLDAGVTPLAAALAVAASIVLLLGFAASHFLGYGEESGGTGFVRPRGIVLLIGVLCFIVFLAEGAMLDWSALFLVEARGLSPSMSGLGYSAFATTMTIGRLTGDRVVRRCGHRRVVALGALCAAAGLATATMSTHWQLALLGFALVGLGCSNVAPVMYSQIGRQSVMPVSLAVPVITVMGYSGILLGPAFIGLLAHRTSLSTAFMAIAAALLVVAATARRLGNH